jgi:hypothetical protein
VVEETVIAQEDPLTEVAVPLEVAQQVDNLNVGSTDELITKTTTVTTFETKVETTVTDNNDNMEVEEKEEEEEPKEEPSASSSSWASTFGIRNLLDVLYAPFKARNSSS